MMCPRCDALRLSAAFVLACQPGGTLADMDTTLLGLAIALDKPIIMVCPPGYKVPEKLAKVVDRFVEYDPEFKVVVAAVAAALRDLGLVAVDANPQSGFDQDDFGPKPSLN